MCADGIAVEPLRGETESLEIRKMLAQILDLVRSRCDREVSVFFDVRVDSVTLQGRKQLTVVFEAELLERFEFFRKVPQAVEDAVRKRWVRKSTVAARGARPDGLRFEQYDVSGWIGFLCLERRPESGEPATRDDEIGLFSARKCGVRSGSFGTVEPITVGGRVGQRQ